MIHMSVKEQLTQELHSIIKKMGADLLPIVEIPLDLEHGDYTTNAAMILAGKLKRKPMEVAEEIISKIKDQRSKIKTTSPTDASSSAKASADKKAMAGKQNSNLKIFEKIEVARPGFINFWLSEWALLQKLNEASLGEQGFLDLGKKRKVVVEYSSPNIAKPFTIGHLRSTIIGDAVANLLEAGGWDVRRDNHVGDWGTQFGKQIYAIKEWGNEGEIEKSDRPVKLLVDLYVKFHQEAAASNAVEKKNVEDAMSASNAVETNVTSIEDEARAWFKRLEEGDSEARRLWQKCIDWSWKEFEKIYKQLDVSFTENNGRGYGESFFEDKMDSIINELEQEKFLKESDGAKLVFFPKDKYPPLMIVKKDGATLYSTRDLATDKFRLQEYGEDIVVINEVGVEQSLYFQQLFELEKMLGWFKEGQRIHIKHGHYRFKDQRMSTRKGNTIWLEDVLEEATRRAYKLSGEANNIADQVAIGAIKWNDLKRDSKQDIMFDWDDVLNMQGNSGPYLQYTFARTQSVIKRSKINPFGKLRTSDQRSKLQGKNQNSNPMAGAGLQPGPECSGASYPPSLSLRRAGKLAPAETTGLPRSFQSLAMTMPLKPEELALLRLLVRFGEVVGEAGERLAPNIVCNYLFILAQAFNLFYQKLPILKGEEEVREFRLGLTEVTGKVIRSGLELLGIKAPERM